MNKKTIRYRSFNPGNLPGIEEPSTSETPEPKKAKTEQEYVKISDIEKLKNYDEVTGKLKFRVHQMSGRVHPAFEVEIKDTTGITTIVLFDAGLKKKFMETLCVGNTYEIWNFKKVPQKEKFRRCEAHTFCIYPTVIAEIDDDGSLPTIDLKPTPLSDVVDYDENAVCDILGVVVKVMESVPKEVKNKFTGETRTTSLQIIYVMDQSLECFPVQFWDGFSSFFNHKLHSVVGIQNARLKFWGVGEAKELQLAMQEKTSAYLVEPKMPQTKSLHSWYMKYQAQDYPSEQQQKKSSKSDNNEGPATAITQETTQRDLRKNRK